MGFFFQCFVINCTRLILTKIDFTFLERGKLIPSPLISVSGCFVTSAVSRSSALKCNGHYIFCYHLQMMSRSNFQYCSLLRAIIKHHCTGTFHGCTSPEVLLTWLRYFCKQAKGRRAVKGRERSFDIAAYCKFGNQPLSCTSLWTHGAFLSYCVVRVYYTASHNTPIIDTKFYDVIHSMFWLLTDCHYP